MSFPAYVPTGQCEDCERASDHLQIWYCVDCDSSYCRCWDRQGPHLPHKRGRDGTPHKQEPPGLARLIGNILDPPCDHDVLTQSHREDRINKWFGVSHDISHRPVFTAYGRLTDIVSENMYENFPQLISFIGVTNAGKSALIKLLIQTMVQRDPEHVFPSPVVGSTVNDSLPTSGDVHLYADPCSSGTQFPLLYADCEGFEGGERFPHGSREAEAGAMIKEDHQAPFIRPIEWATMEELRQREHVVENFYPRILYTFSSCIVFVLRNPKTFHSAVLTKLLDWGATALEGSLNQPVLPHCIVVLNTSDPALDEGEWDVQFSTNSLIAGLQGMNTPQTRRLASQWNARGVSIDCMEDLILRYYKSFKVVRIPARPAHNRMCQQVNRLYNAIKDNCEQSIWSKRKTRMLLRASELDDYLEAAFEHFTSHPDRPFNFMQSSLRLDPIPHDFGDHVLRLCTTLMWQRAQNSERRSRICRTIATMLASCALLDCVHSRKGRLDTIFSWYEKHIGYAMSEFLKRYCPCSFQSRDGRCCGSAREQHNVKGHQDEYGIIGEGDYESNLDVEQWKSWLIVDVDVLTSHFDSEVSKSVDEGQQMPDVAIAWQIHLENVRSVFLAAGSGRAMQSHSSCFICLMSSPEHSLPCGHVFCHNCILRCGRTDNDTTLVQCCPLHPGETGSHPQEFHWKPAVAGLRVLSLDGGGIRGVVQLELLRAVHRYLSSDIPFGAFFDLMVGTGTGGLVANMLATPGRSISDCHDSFEVICDLIFRRSLVELLLPSRRRYRKKATKTFQKAFSQDSVFFDDPSKTPGKPKVVVTSSCESGTVLHANYRRPDSHRHDQRYHFARSHDPRSELKTWQVMCLTMAHYQPFVAQGVSYWDATSEHANPCILAWREAQHISSLESSDVAIILSVGSGMLYNPASTFLGAILQSAESRDGNLADKTWRELQARNDREGEDERMIRLDVDLNKMFPDYDDLSCMRELQEFVRVSLGKQDHALRDYAHRVMALTCFYHTIGIGWSETMHQVLEGRIVCRFEGHENYLTALGETLRSLIVDDFEPYFVILLVSGKYRRELWRTAAASVLDGKGSFNLWVEHLTDLPFQVSVRLHLQADTIGLPVGSSSYNISPISTRTSNASGSASVTSRHSQAYAAFEADGRRFGQIISPNDTENARMQPVEWLKEPSRRHDSWQGWSFSTGSSQEKMDIRPLFTPETRFDFAPTRLNPSLQRGLNKRGSRLL